MFYRTVLKSKNSTNRLLQFHI